ncbi:MAG: hypothetical protein JKX76_00165 [Colwellia sp.]|nr:hypothetical protein [Colwellia sp.]
MSDFKTGQMSDAFVAINAPQIRKDNFPRILFRILLAILVGSVIAIIIGNAVEAAAYVMANI